jgi:hypothetical protein
MRDVRVGECVMRELRIEMMGANGGYRNRFATHQWQLLSISDLLPTAMPSDENDAKPGSSALV